MMTLRSALSSLGLLGLAGLSSCGDLETSETTAVARSAIVKGTASDATQDGVVLVMHYDALAKGGGAASGCTGTLLTPRLVLTARHCVSVTDDGASCGSTGQPISGGVVRGDHQPSALFVFGGTERPDFIAGTARPARGLEILTTGAKTLCNNDIALILLDRALEGASIAPVRLSSPVQNGETVTVVGWGITEDQPNPKTRRQRTDVKVVEVGPGNEVGPAEFATSEGPCSGDSGGPAIAASGAVIGALSRGGNGMNAAGAAACLGGTNVFGSISGHEDLIMDGYDRAGQKPWLEGTPNPLLDPGPAPVAVAASGGGCTVGDRNTSPFSISAACTLAVLFALARRKTRVRSAT